MCRGFAWQEPPAVYSARKRIAEKRVRGKAKARWNKFHRAFAYFPHMPYDTFPSQEGKPMLPEEITFFEKMPSMLSVYQAASRSVGKTLSYAANQGQQNSNFISQQAYFCNGVVPLPPRKGLARMLPDRFIRLMLPFGFAAHRPSGRALSEPLDTPCARYAVRRGRCRAPCLA